MTGIRTLSDWLLVSACASLARAQTRMHSWGAGWDEGGKVGTKQPQLLVLLGESNL